MIVIDMKISVGKLWASDRSTGIGRMWSSLHGSSGWVDLLSNQGPGKAPMEDHISDMTSGRGKDSHESANMIISPNSPQSNTDIDLTFPAPLRAAADASGLNQPTMITGPTASGVVHSKPSNIQPKRSLNYTAAVTSLKEVGTTLPCFCSPKIPTKRICLPTRDVVSYHSVVEILLQ